MTLRQPPYHILGEIAAKLADRSRQKMCNDSRTRAAVAMIMREQPEGVELLFIERAPHDRDPWSGHLAFPGGKVEPGERAREAAERETLEEIGIGLSGACYLGRLSDIIGTNLPVRVSCFAYGIQGHTVEPQLNGEVRDAFWVRLSDLGDRGRHRTAAVGFAGKSLQVPAIVLPQPDKPVLWGITYRLVMQLLEIMQPDDR